MRIDFQLALYKVVQGLRHHILLFCLLVVATGCDRLPQLMRSRIVVLLPPSGSPFTESSAMPQIPWEQEAELFRQLGAELLPQSYWHRVQLELIQVSVANRLKVLERLTQEKKFGPDTVLIWGSTPLLSLKPQERQKLQEIRRAGTLLVAYRYAQQGLAVDLLLEPDYERLGERQAQFLQKRPAESPLLLFSHNSDLVEAFQNYESARQILLESLLQQSREHLRSFPVLFDGEWRSTQELQQILAKLRRSLALRRMKGRVAALGILCPDLTCGRKAAQLATGSPGVSYLSVVVNTGKQSGPVLLTSFLSELEQAQGSVLHLQLLVIPSETMVEAGLTIAWHYLERQRQNKNRSVAVSAEQLSPDLLRSWLPPKLPVSRIIQANAANNQAVPKKRGESKNGEAVIKLLIDAQELLQEP